MKYLVIFSLVLLCACTQPATHKETVHTDSTATTTLATNEKKEDLTVNTSVLEAITSLPDALKGFVPAGYAALDTASGDLNQDGIPDMILVVKSNAEDTLSDIGGEQELRRPMMLLLGQGDNAYKLAAQNDNAVLCHNCGGMFGDPFTGIVIKNGYFSIEHGIAGGQHWESVTTFKYNKEKADWFLYKEGFVNYRFNDADTSEDGDVLVKDVEKQKTVKDFGVVPFGKYDTYKE